MSNEWIAREVIQSQQGPEDRAAPGQERTAGEPAWTVGAPFIPELISTPWTQEYPTLTTFFEGEIISKKHPFLTRKWDADEDVDRKHWGKFLAFYQYAKSFNSDDFDYEELKNGDYVFMRWKEQFLVPDHTIKDISGASFAGFYYICFQKSAASIEGYYYHRSSEWYQSLNLTHVPEHSAPIYEFR
ncbi:glucose-induced degradation protein 4 homolog [Pan paniscus]|nr:glucose-induced degradation protein 4 homolog [Pan paniscus]